MRRDEVRYDDTIDGIAVTVRLAWIAGFDQIVELPGALPYVFSGMKVAAILAVAGAVVGEFIASDSGLGRPYETFFGSLSKTVT